MYASINPFLRNVFMTKFFDFNEIEVKSSFKDRYKGIAGENHRIGIIYPKANGKETQGPFIVGNTHYSDKYFLCKESVCCDKIGPSKQRFACLVIKYKTVKDGTLRKDAGDENIPFGFEVIEWVFTGKKFTQLKNLHSEWDLSSIDIKVSCGDNENFQDLTFTPCKESLWQSKPQFKEAVYRESEAMRPSLEKALGQDLSISDIKELLGLEDSNPSDVISNSEDLTDILDQVE